MGGRDRGWDARGVCGGGGAGGYEERFDVINGRPQDGAGVGVWGGGSHARGGARRGEGGGGEEWSVGGSGRDYENRERERGGYRGGGGGGF